MKYIKAPYNFVPLNAEVVIPHWTNFVSHDIPFEDGQSGTIEVTLKAESPLFVRNGMTKEEREAHYNPDGEQGKCFQFENFRGKYFIPGSSLKGMVRNVLEIISFSSMKAVDDNRYAYRDLNNEKYKNAFKEVKCGWLYKDEKTQAFYLTDCGNPGRISHKEIDNFYKTSMADFFSDKNKFKASSEEQKSARFKYKMVESDLNQKFESIGESAGRKLYRINPYGEKSGQIIFTGQPGIRKKGNNGKWTGHHLEFIFFLSDKSIKVDEKVINDFKFAYHEKDPSRWSVDWKFWRLKLAKGEKIPVFFQKDENGKVKDIGLSYLYKLPYNKSVKKSIAQKGQGYDMAETIFGFASQSRSLKGRVHFGHAFSTENAEPDQDREAILATPKASYYPNYIQQESREKYRTYDDGVVSGWKRYPVHKAGTQSNITEREKQKKMLTRFTPLKPGAVFHFTIRYHNLKKVELGALVSALSFHGHREAFHSLGLAKPLGYGKVSLTIENMKDYQPFMKEFELYMNAKLSYREPEWNSSPQVKELVTMALEQDNKGESLLEYMKLGRGRAGNEFVEAKNQRESLKSYSELNNVKPGEIISLITADDLRTYTSTLEKEEQLISGFMGLKDTAGIENKLRERLEYEFENKKEALIQKLKEQKEENRKKEDVEKEAREKEKISIRKEARSRESRKQGLDLSGINSSDKKAFDEIRKAIERFVCTIHKDNNYKRLLTRFPEGVLPKEYHDTLIEKIREIKDLAVKKEKARWNLPFEKNVNLKKTAEWIGESKTREI